MKTYLRKWAGKAGGLAGLILMAAACAKPPTQEISQAENAVNAAIQSGAEEYAAGQLQLAQEALNDANAKVESKDYKGAKTAAMDAKAKAEQASAQIEANKQAAKTEASGKIEPLKTRVEAVKAALAKLSGPAVDAMKAPVEALGQAWDSLQADYNGERYSSALQKMADMETQLAEMEGKVAQAAAQSKKQKRTAPATKRKRKK